MDRKREAEREERREKGTVFSQVGPNGKAQKRFPSKVSQSAYES